MSEFLTLFGDIKLATVILFFVAIGFLIKYLTKGYKEIMSGHDILKKKKEDFSTLSTTVEEIKKSVDALTTKINTIEQNQINLQQQHAKFEQDNRKQRRNALRDTLLQSYRYYTSHDKNPTGKWTEMEKDAFEKLFEDYEELDGNGYMHTTVKPELLSLEVIRMDDTDNIGKLMLSRKG